MINQIKWAYQRVVRGYDDRIFWGFDEYLNCIIPAIQLFCEEELNTDHIKLNKKREKVFKEMLKLIDDCYKMDVKEYNFNNNPSDKIWKHFGANIGYFWN